ncbi:MAG TPA: glycosyltransferase family 4 protein [Firmicutes bacterium]|nr:glycosyltransferase family 4 protein [Bacillota bacterium]
MRYDILYVIRPAAGGMREHVFHLARGMASKGYRVAIVGPQDVYSGETIMARELEAAGVDLILLPLVGSLSPLHDAAACARLMKIIVGARPEIVHTHGFKASLVGRLAVAASKPFFRSRLLLKLPFRSRLYHESVPGCVCTVHNSIVGQYGAHSAAYCIVKLSERTLAPFSDATIVVSEALKREYEELSAGRCRAVRFIPNGIDLARFSPRRNDVWTPGQFRIGTVARLIPQKGVGTLIRAFPAIKELYPSAELLIVGDGVERPALEGLCGELRLKDSVRFLGYREDVPEILRELDVFVLASESEGGMSLSIIEAMASRIPVIATHIGGIPEIVQDRITGILIPPGDPVALAEAVKWVFSNLEEVSKLVSKAYDTVKERFSATAMVDEVHKVYEMVWVRAGERETEIHG